MTQSPGPNRPIPPPDPTTARGDGVETAWMTRRYLLALTVIALLAAAAYGAFQMLLSQHDNVIAVVNISGRQRMLSQRSALFVQQLTATTDAAQARRVLGDLAETAHAMAAAHEGLTRGSPELGLPDNMSRAVSRMYFDGPMPLDRQMKRFFGAIESILSQPPGTVSADSPAVKLVLSEAEGPLLRALDTMVLQYQHEGELALARLEVLETLVAALTFITLGLEAMLIFRPMVRQAQRQVSAIGIFTEQLRRARDNLESQVSERTRELEQAKGEAERANLAKSRFLAAASHDLKQPLEAIGMFSGMLERKSQDPRTQAILQDLHAAQRSMRRLLDSLIEISKLEAGVVSPKPEPVALQPLLAQLVSEYRPFAAEKGLELRLVPTRAWTVTDAGLLERILRNLLSNAVRYTEQGRVLVGCRNVGKSAVSIEVLDTGPGIPDQDLGRVFEEFRQLDRPDRDRSEGIGLGLAIVERLAHLLRHRVIARSKLGRGSRFALTVPRIKAPDADQERARTASL